MTAADLLGNVGVDDGSAELDVAFPEFTIKYTSDLLEDFGDLEGSYILGERSFADVVDLFEIENSMEDALGLIKRFVSDGST